MVALCGMIFSLTTQFSLNCRSHTWITLCVTFACSAKVQCAKEKYLDCCSQLKHADIVLAGSDIIERSLFVYYCALGIPDHADLKCDAVEPLEKCIIP